MMKSEPGRESSRTRWRWGFIAAVAITLLACLPEAALIVSRGNAWHGSFFVTYYDEVGYSAYINALIDGRPRRNDPYTGRDALRGEPEQAESQFSIQFIPAYLIAMPARVLGLSASTVFRLLTPICAFTAALAIFWLLSMLTRDERFAAVSALCILCFGALAGTPGSFQLTPKFEAGVNFFSFLRRFQPAASFPVFFLLCAFVWKGIIVGDERARARFKWAITAGLAFAFLVYSYFYLWTAAAAWLVCLAALMCAVSLAQRFKAVSDDKVERGEPVFRLVNFGLLALIAVVALVPYFMLLSRRAAAMDTAQALTRTHAPDLWRTPEIIAAFVICALALCAWRGVIKLTDCRVIMAASFALAPFALFNQQIVTGHSLQPIHYEGYIANYLSLVAVALTIAIVWSAIGSKPKLSGLASRALALLTLFAVGWGVVEASGMIARRMSYARFRDDAAPVFQRLAQLAQTDGTLDAANKNRNPRPVVFCTSLSMSDDLPTTAPQAVLWAEHMSSYSGATPAEAKERFYQYLYYSGATSSDLVEAFKRNEFSVTVALFGMERAIPALSANPQPITFEEVRKEVDQYTRYAAAFDDEQARRLPLTYLIVPAEAMPDLSNLEKFYEHDAGEAIGPFMLYKLKLRAP